MRVVKGKGGKGHGLMWRRMGSSRMLNPCTDGTCDWINDTTTYMTTRRWYPTVEVRPDLGGRMPNADGDRPADARGRHGGDRERLPIHFRLFADSSTHSSAAASGEDMSTRTTRTTRRSRCVPVPAPLVSSPYADTRSFSSSQAAASQPP